MGDILRSGAGLAGSLLSLFNQKVKFINMILTDQVTVTVNSFFSVTVNSFAIKGMERKMKLVSFYIDAADAASWLSDTNLSQRKLSWSISFRRSERAAPSPQHWLITHTPSQHCISEAL